MPDPAPGLPPEPFEPGDLPEAPPAEELVLLLSWLFRTDGDGFASM